MPTAWQGSRLSSVRFKDDFSPKVSGFRRCTMAAAALISSCSARTRSRTALVASADGSFRQSLSTILTGLRWQVREAQGGAAAWGEALDMLPQAIIVDSWLPDLDVAEFLHEFRIAFPAVDVVTAGNASALESAPGPHRQEILYALRRIQETDTAAWNSAPLLDDTEPEHRHHTTIEFPIEHSREANHGGPIAGVPLPTREIAAKNAAESGPRRPALVAGSGRILELIGESPCMLEISRRIRLVAPRTTPVLIEGPTGSGKELVAEALHRLSTRSRKPFVAINCAAIPEALLEAELFGHARGAFTGAVQRRTGRIEAANGGTLLLDEIGEMPLALQSKLLRFLESGELQRVGENETVRVDVRIVAATHQPLARRAQEGSFRADLFYRLSVFRIQTPALAEHLEDLPVLSEHFLESSAGDEIPKQLDEEAFARLAAHAWPGNVR